MLDYTYKEILWLISVALVVPQIVIYIRSMLKWYTKPHIYTKIIWFILTGIGFIIQYNAWGWPGAWILWVTCVNQFLTVVLSLKYWTKDITKFDTILLMLALLCIPLYLWVENKVYALLFVVFIDFLWYIPTYRKTYNDPYSEDLFVWSITNVKYVIAFFALASYSFETAFYIIFLIVANALLMFLIIFRRKHIPKKAIE